MTSTALLKILLLLTFSCLTTSELCPLSSTMDLNNSHNFFYPLDVYASKSLFHSTLAANNTFPCYARYKDLKYHHHCSGVRFCPIIAENINDAMKVRSQASSLCNIKQKLANKEENINVFIFGGSVTAGGWAAGCTDHDPADHTVGYPRCAWAYHFGEWIRHYYAATVNTYNLAHPGCTSYMLSRSFPSKLKELNIQSFTSRDVLFLDHAVNDHYSKLYMSEVEMGLESLILQIYALSNPNSWPTIIVLDSNPSSFRIEKRIYPIAYENITKYYSLSMWSYADAVLSNNSLILQKNYSSALRWRENHMQSIHPMWHLHLFYADFLASIFVSELSKCDAHTIDVTTKLHESKLQLPIPHILTVENNCGEESTFLSINYDALKNNKTIIGGYATLPENSWKIREDKKDRGGFIVELEHGKYPLPLQQNASIIFKLSESTSSLMTKFTSVHIKMMYLRTYENAGSVVVFLCGKQKKLRLSGLWEDKTKRVSIPDLYEEEFPLTNCVLNNFTNPVVEFVHDIVPGNAVILGNQKFKIMNIEGCAVNHVH